MIQCVPLKDFYLANHPTKSQANMIITDFLLLTLNKITNSKIQTIDKKYKIFHKNINNN